MVVNYFGFFVYFPIKTYVLRPEFYVTFTGFKESSGVVRWEKR